MVRLDITLFTYKVQFTILLNSMYVLRMIYVILRKIPVNSEKKGIPATSPKPRSSEKFLRKTQENKKILRNPVRNAFLGTKNKFPKRGITNLGKCGHRYEIGLDILAGNIVWVNGPFAAGKYPDVE